MPERPVSEEAPLTVELKTMGALALTGTEYHRPTGLTLLTYLALEGPVPRSHLHALFWPDRDQAAASLRTLLSTLKKVLPPRALMTEGQAVSVHLPCDALRLLAGEMASEDPYPGPFLQGVQLGAVSSELEEWVEATRERVALVVQRQLLSRSERTRSLAEVQRLLTQCLRLPGAAPLEPAMLQRMLAMAPTGSEVERLIRSELRDLDPALLPTPGARAGRLLGRDRPVAELLALLVGGERLVELTGAGGIGKTSVLLTLLQEAAPLFGGQAVLIDLEDVTDSAQAAGQLAMALGLQLPTGGNPWTALGAAVADTAWLLALDGTEHLNDLADGVEHLLAQAPQVQVVTGGHRRLMRRGPHLLLEGLGTPAPELDPLLIRQVDGVKLFLQVAAQVVQPLPSQNRELQMMGAIVRRLDGHPLAIRLAALELAGQPLAALYQQVLNDRLSDAPPLQQLYQRARSRLNCENRLVLTQLAKLPAMSVDDAAQITGAGLSQFAELQALALLSNRDGRLQVMPVLKPLAAAEQTPDDAVRTRHASTFLARLADWAPGGVEAGRERINIVQALLTRLEGSGGEVAQIEWLRTHFEQQGLLAEGLETLARLSRAAGTAPIMVQAALQVARAWLAFRSARFQDAEGLARELTVQTDPATRDAQMKGFNILYAVLIQQQGRTEDAVIALERAIALAEQLGNPQQKAMYLGNLCEARIHQGAYIAAREALTAAMQARAAYPPGPEEAMNRVRDLGLRYDTGEAGPLMVRDAEHLLSELPALQAEWVSGDVLIILGKAAGRAGQITQVMQAVEALEVYLQHHPSPVLVLAS